MGIDGIHLASNKFFYRCVHPSVPADEPLNKERIPIAGCCMEGSSQPQTGADLDQGRPGPVGWSDVSLQGCAACRAGNPGVSETITCWLDDGSPATGPVGHRSVFFSFVL